MCVPTSAFRVADGPDCPACDEAIKQLEQIDDDTDAVGVKFVKTDDAEFASEFGISEFPAILYFEDKEPSIYDGNCKILGLDSDLIMFCKLRNI